MAQLSIFGPGGAGNPAPAPADPQLIRILNPEAAAPPYGSPTSSTNNESSNRTAQQPAVSSPPLAGAVPNNQRAPSLVQAVRQFDLGSRDIARDVTTDIYDYQGNANREETLTPTEAEHAAVAQIDGRSTAANLQPSQEGERLNRFRQGDVELGRIPHTSAGRQG